jgi:hypothetical protein
LDDLINAIAAVIASKVEHAIYIDDIGEGFERPSFFIYRISDLDTPMNRWTYNTNAIIQIVYFSALDDHKNIANKADQTDTIQTIKHAFMSSLGIKFGDKFAHLEKTTVDYTGDKDIFLQLTFNITYGTRKDYDESQNTQLMQEFKFKEGV